MNPRPGGFCARLRTHTHTHAHMHTHTRTQARTRAHRPADRASPRPPQPSCSAGGQSRSWDGTGTRSQCHPRISGICTQSGSRRTRSGIMRTRTVGLTPEYLCECSPNESCCPLLLLLPQGSGILPWNAPLLCTPPKHMQMHLHLQMHMHMHMVFAARECLRAAAARRQHGTFTLTPTLTPTDPSTHTHLHPRCLLLSTQERSPCLPPCCHNCHCFRRCCCCCCCWWRARRRHPCLPLQPMPQSHLHQRPLCSLHRHACRQRQQNHCPCHARCGLAASKTRLRRGCACLQVLPVLWRQQRGPAQPTVPPAHRGSS